MRGSLAKNSGRTPQEPADHLKGTPLNKRWCLEQKAAWQLLRKMGQIQVGKCSQKLQNDAQSASCVFLKKDRLFYTWKKKYLSNLCEEEQESRPALKPVALRSTPILRMFYLALKRTPAETWGHGSEGKGPEYPPKEVGPSTRLKIQGWQYSPVGEAETREPLELTGFQIQ